MLILAQAPEIEMSVTVLTSNAWPTTMTQKPPSCNLPDCMQTSALHFERFYLSRHSGRKVVWQLTLGTADIRVAFKSRKHDLNVSTLALVILLLFEDVNDGEFLTYEVSMDLVVVVMPDSRLFRKSRMRRDSLNRN